MPSVHEADKRSVLCAMVLCGRGQGGRAITPLKEVVLSMGPTITNATLCHWLNRASIIRGVVGGYVSAVRGRIRTSVGILINKIDQAFATNYERYCCCVS